MGFKTKLLVGLMGLSGYENYMEKLEKENKKPSMTNAYEHFGKPAVDRILKVGSSVAKSVTGKADGGMMNARKKNMGLKMNVGGMVPGKFKGFSKLPESVQEKMDSKLAKKYMYGGAVKKYGHGGSVEKDGVLTEVMPKEGTPSTKMENSGHSRGGGAAISGTKFTGVK